MVVNPVDPTSGSYRILVYGAGVLGSLYAARFGRLAGASASWPMVSDLRIFESTALSSRTG